MNNKAFTLIELIAIILILGAIFLVSFPSLLGIMKSDDEKQLSNMVDNLCSAGKSYIYSNEEQYQNISIPGSVISVSVEELVLYGTVDKDLKNPNTNKSVIDDGLLFTVGDDNSLSCQYVVGGAVDLSEYFSVTDFKFCQDVVYSNGSFTCSSENESKEYASLSEVGQGNKACAPGSTDNAFFSIIDWTFDYENYNGVVSAGSYANIPLYRDVYTEQGMHEQTVVGGGLTSNNDLIVQGIKIGTWRIINSAKSRTLQIVFTDGITELINESGMTSISGQFKTPKVFYAPNNHIETRDVVVTAGDRNENLCILKTTPNNPASNSFGHGHSLVSNNFVEWRLITAGKTFNELCTAFETGGVIPDSSIYENLRLEVNLGSNSDYKIDVLARMNGLDITKLPNEYKAVTSGYGFSLTSFFTKDKNPAANYATLASYRENIQPLHYGLYIDRSSGDRIFVINFGDQPSKLITYTDAIQRSDPNCASYGCSNVGSYLKSYRPFTLNNTEVNGFNAVHGVANASNLGHNYSGGNVIAFQATLTQYFETVSEPTTVSISPTWYWVSEGVNKSYTREAPTTATLQSAQSVASSN